MGHYHEDIFGVTLRTAEVTDRVRNAAKKYVNSGLCIVAVCHETNVGHGKLSQMLQGKKKWYDYSTSIFCHLPKIV